MKEIKMKKKRMTKIKKLSFFERIKNYAQNCRYSFNRMLST